MESNKNTQFFAELAKAYVEKDGIALKKEFSEMKDEMNLLGVTKKIKRKIRRRRFITYASLVASIIAIMLIYSSYAYWKQGYTGNNTTSLASSDTQVMNELRYSVELLTASLPTGYALTGVDYDNYAAIMKIENEKNNRIIVTAEKYNDFYKDDLKEIDINGVTAYGIVKNDYCVLKYSKDNMLYTLTCLYDIDDLIEISKNIL